jgi:hypothetical protein
VHELVGPDLGRRALDDDAAVVHHRHALRDPQRHIHVVLDEDQRHVAFKGQQQLREREPLAAREARGRLVEHHDLRVAGARHPHLELALLAVGERADDGSEPILEPDSRRQVAGALPECTVTAG